MFKKVLAVLLTVCLTAGLAGCGSKGETAATTEETAGRYVEKQMNLPEGVDGSQILQIGKKEDSLVLYVLKEQAAQISIASYLYQDGAYKENTPEWLSGLSFGKEEITTHGGLRVVENVNGKSYLFCTNIENDSWKGRLYCSEDGKTAKDITPEDWLKEDEQYHIFECPNDIAVLDDGTLIGYFSYMIRVYDTQTLAIAKEISFENRYSDKIYANKDSYYVIAQSDYGDFNGIEVYQKDDDKAQETMALETALGNSNFLDFQSDGSMILTGQNGIMKRSAKNNEWSMVVKGVYTSFGLESMWCMGMAALDSDVYYALFSDDTLNATLVEYTFDPTIQAEPGKTLTVYSVYDNAAVKQAAAMYTMQNPNVLVEVECAIPNGEEESADENAILQNLNTKLIAGEGADLLVMDALDTDAFIEKGMLENISDVITPMAEDGTILDNIANCYTREDGSVYMMPLKFSMNLLIGDKIDAEKTDTVKTLAAQLANIKEPVFGAMTTEDFVNAFVPYVTADFIRGKELNKEALTADLEELKTIAENGGLVEKYPEEERGWNIWDIPSDAGAAFYDAAGFLQAMFPMAVTKFVNGSFTSFENAFTPIGVVSVNSACEDKELAKDFLQFMFSFQMQDGDFYDGFPVNVRALENQITKDRSDYAAYTEIEVDGGGYVEFVIDEISPEHNQRLVELCKSVDKVAIRDAKVQSVIAEAFPAYLNGSSSLEDTIIKIERGLNMYLAE